MRARSWLAWCWLVLVPLVLTGCGWGQKTTQDAGPDAISTFDDGPGRTPCVWDSDCTPPETCQTDHYCEYVVGPKPEDNRLAGHFDLRMNNTDPDTMSVSVTGKVDARYVYLDYGQIGDRAGDPKIYIELYGIITNNLYESLVMEVPKASQKNIAVSFADGTGIGTVDLVNLNNAGNETSRKSIAQIIGGDLSFSEIGTDQDNRCVASFRVDVKMVQPGN